MSPISLSISSVYDTTRKTSIILKFSYFSIYYFSPKCGALYIYLLRTLSSFEMLTCSANSPLNENWVKFYVQCGIFIVVLRISSKNKQVWVFWDKTLDCDIWFRLFFSASELHKPGIWFQINRKNVCHILTFLYFDMKCWGEFLLLNIL